MTGQAPYADMTITYGTSASVTYDITQPPQTVRQLLRVVAGLPSHRVSAARSRTARRALLRGK